jgi:hypothetical protein
MPGNRSWISACKAKRLSSDFGVAIEVQHIRSIVREDVGLRQLVQYMLKSAETLALIQKDINHG